MSGKVEETTNTESTEATTELAEAPKQPIAKYALVAGEYYPVGLEFDNESIRQALIGKGHPDMLNAKIVETLREDGVLIVEYQKQVGKKG